MDIWLLLSMMFVALAIFEYAVLLAIRFGKGRKKNTEEGRASNKEKLCSKMDRTSLKMFLGTYILTVVTYILVVAHIE